MKKTKLKVVPSESLQKDPYWQVALRDQGYDCGRLKRCWNAGCHKHNPVIRKFK